MKTKGNLTLKELLDLMEEMADNEYYPTDHKDDKNDNIIKMLFYYVIYVLGSFSKKIRMRAYKNGKTQWWGLIRFIKDNIEYKYEMETKELKNSRNK